jgi:hypothetical protein
VDRNEFGTPLLDGVFRRAHERARHGVLVYVNSDLILLGCFVPAALRLAGQPGFERFLMIGQRTDLPVPEPLDFGAPDWEPRLRAAAARGGSFSPRACKDYFVFPRPLYRGIPPFAVGRGNWDNWVVFQAHGQGIPVVDATPVVTVIHQHHGHGHLSGGRLHAYDTGAEARRNAELAGGRHLAVGLTRSWVLTPAGVRRSRLPWPAVQFAAELPRLIRLRVALRREGRRARRAARAAER